jgi:hypothetical protein
MNPWYQINYRMSSSFFQRPQHWGARDAIQGFEPLDFDLGFDPP